VTGSLLVDVFRNLQLRPAEDRRIQGRASLDASSRRLAGDTESTSALNPDANLVSTRLVLDGHDLCQIMYDMSEPLVG
jgi:hypothetical protein